MPSSAQRAINYEKNLARRRPSQNERDCFLGEKCQVVCTEGCRMFCWARFWSADAARERTGLAVVSRQIPVGFNCVKRQHRCSGQLPLGRDRKEQLRFSTTSKNSLRVPLKLAARHDSVRRCEQGNIYWAQRQCSIERKLLSAEQKFLVHFSKENTLNSAKFFRVRVRVRVRVRG